MLENFVNNKKDTLYFAFRLFVGLLFLLSGWVMLSEVLNGNVELGFTLYSITMVLELIGGLFILVGFKTRQTALVCGLLMLIVYFATKAINGWNPIVTNGIVELLFLAAFIVIFSQGAGKLAIDKS
ncbi:MAG TPA: DoxX family protein [Candidatus Nanoarchaeia archaeon]|nr:DoxX family protein [Candidatus Nanoarchaeia archaeon]